MVQEGIAKLSKTDSYPAIVSLLNGVVFQNVYNDDVEKNTEIVNDIVNATADLNPGEKSQKKVKSEDPKDSTPQDVIVDSLVALTSTTHPQMRHLINSAYTSLVSFIT